MSTPPLRASCQVTMAPPDPSAMIWGTFWSPEAAQRAVFWAGSPDQAITAPACDNTSTAPRSTHRKAKNPRLRVLTIVFTLLDLPDAQRAFDPCSVAGRV